MWFLGFELRTSKEQSVLLTAEPSLQPPGVILTQSCVALVRVPHLYICPPRNRGSALYWKEPHNWLNHVLIAGPVCEGKGAWGEAGTCCPSSPQGVSNGTESSQQHCVITSTGAVHQEATGSRFYCGLAMWTQLTSSALVPTVVVGTA
jgi:hypothetical protein